MRSITLLAGFVALLPLPASADCIYGGCTPEQQALEDIATQLDDLNRSLGDMRQQRLNEQGLLQIEQMRQRRDAAIEQERQRTENLFRSWALPAPSSEW